MSAATTAPLPSLPPLPPLPPLIVGEVLHDHFPDGQKVLGGAPFNVAWNLQGFGVPTFFLSAVGRDSNGEKIREKMKSWGMDDAGLQFAQPATGQVSVTFQDGQPAYDIVHPAAFDRIDMDDASAFSGKHSLLYLGSLILRDPHNQKSIGRLIRDADLPRLVDINIRHPWLDASQLDLLLGDAKWLKLSDEELVELTSTTACDNLQSVQEGAQQLRSRYAIENIFVTAGGSGAYFINDDGIVHAPASGSIKIVDTVGAGDAFTAATIAGLLQTAGGADDRLTKVDAQRILEKAVAFASRVCGISGATSGDRAFYTLR